MNQMRLVALLALVALIGLIGCSLVEAKFDRFTCDAYQLDQPACISCCQQHFGPDTRIDGSAFRNMQMCACIYDA